MKGSYKAFHFFLFKIRNPKKYNRSFKDFCLFFTETEASRLQCPSLHTYMYKFLKIK